MFVGVPDYQRVAEEFGLGRLLEATPLAGGRAGVRRLVTTRGQFVIKPAGRPAEALLYEQVALILNKAGVRQARPLRTVTGGLTGEWGHTAQEFLPGRIFMRPSAAQTLAVMRHLGEYHAALARVPSGPPSEVTIWTQVTSPGFLLRELPGLADRARAALPSASQEVIHRALGRLRAAVPRMSALPRQLIHGDIGPDNVLMDGDQVVAVIDFTPHTEPVIFAIAGAVYWYHAYGHPALDLAAMRAGLEAAGAHRPWTSEELATWPAMLLREALRRVATTLATTEPADIGAVPSFRLRYQALASLLDAWPGLAP
jgi:Ser/Thr protein kinase RdoA (MazF antagonist)